jgi:hypothetical protein
MSEETTKEDNNVLKEWLQNLKAFCDRDSTVPYGVFSFQTAKAAEKVFGVWDTPGVAPLTLGALIGAAYTAADIQQHSSAWLDLRAGVSRAGGKRPVRTWQTGFC